MDLTAARDASIRLEPLRRLLADVKLAVDGAVQAQQDQQEAATATEALRNQVEDLRAQLVDLRMTLGQAQATCELEAIRYQNLAAQQRDEYQVQKDTADAALVEYKARLQAQRTGIEGQEKALVDAAVLVRLKAEQDLAAVQSALETLQARVKGI